MRLGILGAGQLGRMLALAGYPLGLRFRCFDRSPDVSAAEVAPLVVGRYDDPDALVRFADGLDALTYEWENVPVEAIRRLSERVPVYPAPQALESAQDRLTEKRFFESLGITVPPFAAVDTREDLEAAVSRLGLPAVLKTRRMGYDGKGQAVLREAADLDPAWRGLGGVPLILEGWVPFAREVSLVAARGRDGATACYPLVENHHPGGILGLTLAPAPALDPALQAAAERYARAILEALDYTGVLAVELFQVDGPEGPRLVANEMAPRVHNSGHWTIEGAETSQFENHVRAVSGLPLGSTALRGCAAMLNLIGEVPDAAEILRHPGAHLHLYGKTPAPGRKLGHITLLAPDPATLRDRLEALLPVVEASRVLSTSPSVPNGPGG